MTEKNIPEKDKSIGAFWEKQGAKGTTYYTGQIMVNGQKYPIVMFLNSHKTQDKHPKFTIYLSEPKKNAGN